MRLKILETFHYVLQGAIAQNHLILPIVIDKLDPGLPGEVFGNQKKSRLSSQIFKRPLKSLENLEYFDSNQEGDRNNKVLFKENSPYNDRAIK